MKELLNEKVLSKISRTRSLFFKEKELSIALAVYVLVLSFASLLKHHFFFTTAWDLGIFDQILYFSLHGKPFQYNVEPWFTGSWPSNFLAVHFSPILLAFLPIYALMPRAGTLLVLQTIIIACASIPLYAIALEELKDRRLALVAALTYLAHPATIGANLFDFHLETLLPLTMSTSIYFLRKKRRLSFLLAFVTSLMTIEYVGALFVLVMLIELARSKCYKSLRSLITYCAIIAVSITYFLGASNIIQAHRVVFVGESVEKIAFRNIITNPFVLFYDVGNKVFYLIIMLMPYAFIPLLRPLRLLPFILWSLMAYATNYGPYYSVCYQYGIVFVPLLSMAFVDSLRESDIQILNLNMMKLLKISLSLSLMISALVNLSPYITNPYFTIQTFQRAQTISKVMSLIPPGASILTQNEIFPHISNRMNSYVLHPDPFSDPFGVGESRVYLNYTKQLIERVEYEYALFDLKRMNKRLAELAISGLVSRGYGVYAYIDGITIFKKGYSGEPVFYEPERLVLDYRSLILLNGERFYDPTSRSGFVLRHDRGSGFGTFWYGPYILLLPGEYEVTFRLKLLSPCNNTVLVVDVADEGGKVILAKKEVHASQLILNEWCEIKLNFTNNRFRFHIEFRGISVEDECSIALDYVSVTQKSFSST